MIETGYIAVFLIGLLGGVHCAGMCGGIVSALSAQPVPQPSARSASSLSLHLAYNLGRVSSYAIAGAIAGAVGSLGLLLNDMLPIQLALYIAANLMLIALGLYLTGMTQSLAFTERLGQSLWRRIQPYSRRFLPARRVAQAYPLGLLWGWLPCGMVYGVLSTALLAGSASRGAMTMLAFGLGTLPNLLLAGMLLKRLRDVTRARYVRLASGLLVIGFGIWGLFNATSLGGKLWQGLVC
jgi:sulfite exporter TauE/SafE